MKCQVLTIVLCRNLAVAFCSWMLVSSFNACADTQVNVVGLFSGKAVLVINSGPPRILTVGQTSPEGVKLLAADSGQASLEVDGKQRCMAISQSGAVVGSRAVPVMTMYANREGHFFGTGQVNGKTVKFLLDTGATVIAMSSAEARRIGIDYLAGDEGTSFTAGGLVKAWTVNLNSVKLGAISLNQVEGVVIDGEFPPMVLLGMSALNRIEMKRDGISMTLTKKY